MKKAAAVLCLLFMTVNLLLMSSCHGSNGLPEFAIPEEFDYTKEYELVFWAKNDTNKIQTKVYTDAIASFQELYPNVKIKLSLYSDYGRIYNDVITNIATNTTPDICITYPDHIATYMTSENTVVQLDGLFADEKYGLGGSELRYDSPSFDEIVPQFISECMIKGHYYAIPFMRSTEACYINKTFVEALGYGKEFDWTERILYVGDKVDERYTRMAEIVKKRYELNEMISNDMKTGEIIDNYADKIFALLDEAYRKLHGTVPFTEKAKQSIIAGLRIIVKARYISCIADKEGNLVAFGLLLPAIWHALRKSRGKLFPFGIFYFLPLLWRKPTEMEMALIGVTDEYRNSGANAMVIARLWQNVIDDGIKQLESNANLEDNLEINNLLGKFPQKQHKRRRCLIKYCADK